LQTIHNSEREAIRNRRNEKENLITKPLDRTSIEEAEFAENPIKSRPEEIRSMKIIYTTLALFTAFASVAYAATEDTTILKVKSVKSYENGTNEIRTFVLLLFLQVAPGVITLGATARSKRRRIHGTESAASFRASSSRISKAEKEDKAGRICRSVTQRV
jgi:hypothetical protein